MYGFNELKRKLTKTLTNVARVWGQPVVTWGLRKSKTVVKTMVSHDDQHDHHRHHRHHVEHHVLDDEQHYQHYEQTNVDGCSRKS